MNTSRSVLNGGQRFSLQLSAIGLGSDGRSDGHFPTIENPPPLIEYLKPQLDYVRSKVKHHE